MRLQIKNFDVSINKLHKRYGSLRLFPICGAGCIKNPKLALLFMNPTARNVSAYSQWQGLRAPWIGTKNVWKMFYQVGFISKNDFDNTQKLKPFEWTGRLANQLYTSLYRKRIYITNLAKCTQDDARPLGNDVFRAYRTLTLEEIYQIDPQSIITFGNQVSSLFVDKLIKVSEYVKNFERIKVHNKFFEVFPTYYPVGQGMRNMDKAIERIKELV
jgi:hypothetical protein